MATLGVRHVDIAATNVRNQIRISRTNLGINCGKDLTDPQLGGEEGGHVETGVQALVEGVGSGEDYFAARLVHLVRRNAPNGQSLALHQELNFARVRVI